MTIAIEGIRVPDSTLAREIAEFVRGCGNAIAFLSFQPLLLPGCAHWRATWPNVRCRAALSRDHVL
jgi:hypothetical protein